jgi:hypothetical protein
MPAPRHDLQQLRMLEQTVSWLHKRNHAHHLMLTICMDKGDARAIWRLTSGFGRVAFLLMPLLVQVRAVRGRAELFEHGADVK